jgi:hypothetical protein
MTAVSGDLKGGPEDFQAIQHCTLITGITRFWG